MQSPSLVPDSGENSGFSFLPVMNNDGLLTHNMPKTFYYRWKFALKASTQIQSAAHLTHYAIPQV